MCAHPYEVRGEILGYEKMKNELFVEKKNGPCKKKKKIPHTFHHNICYSNY